MEAKPVRSVEGMSRALRFGGSGMLGVLGAVVLFQLRALLHTGSNQVDFNTVTTWLPIGFAILVLVVPTLHQLVHWLAAQASGAGVKIIVARGFFHVRPARPVRCSTARRFFLLPLLISAAMLLLLPIRALSAYAALISAFNLAWSANDLWKYLGLRQLDPQTQLQLQLDTCDVVDATA